MGFWQKNAADTGIAHNRTGAFARGTRSAALAGLALVASTALVACGADETEGTETPNEVISVTITDDKVAPLGERIKVNAGEPITVEITADHEGALHVHSSPEHSLEFEDGTVTREFTLDRPGVVEVESHDPDLVILQLEVR